MEDTLTDCLVRVREDLRNLKKVRDYIDANAETEERCSVTWRTIEAFNSILSVCSSQNTPETNALDTLLDSFYYLARNNSDDSVWEDFGFELGIICVKILSAIERSEIFEILFCKLLSVISIICEHNSNVWKAAARQILNVLINKKVSLSYLEAILKLYISILKNIDSLVLHDFSSQNLHLLKALSLLVQNVGDFEIQTNVIQLIFLHLSSEKKLMSDFFSTVEKKLFQSLQFADFEDDCRLYLNAVNKPRRGFERKVYSICCHVLYLGGSFLEPPIGKNSIWVDANKDTERLSIKYGDIESDGNHIILIQFSEILNVQLESDKTEGNRCLTIQTKNLMSMHKDATNNDICLVAENLGELFEFVRFLEAIGEKKKKKTGGKESKTIDRLFIDRNSPRMEVQDNAITSSERPVIDHILPDVLSLFEKANETTARSSQTIRKCKITPSRMPKVVLESQELSPNSFVESLNKHIGSPERVFQDVKPSQTIRKSEVTPSRMPKVVLESQELSPNSFVESLNKHIGSPEHAFEDSIETIEFLQKATPGNHKLFRTPDKIFDILEEKETNFNFLLENKENFPFEVPKPKIKTYNRKSRKLNSELPKGRVLRDKKIFEVKLSNTQSEDYFQAGPNVLEKKKPCFPRLKRNAKPTKTSKNKNRGNEKKNKTEQNRPNDIETLTPSKEVNGGHNQSNSKRKHREGQNSNEKPRATQQVKAEVQEERRKTRAKEFGRQNEFKLEVKLKERYELKEKPKQSKVGKSSYKKQTEQQQSKVEVELPKQSKSRTTEVKHDAKPSLLDPNGYAYQRWCKPTTSERSNFWLRKLDAKQKPKTDSDTVFDFSDESDSPTGKSKNKKRIVHSKRKCKARTKQTSLRQVKEILKKSSHTMEKLRKTPRESNKTEIPNEPAPTLPKEASPEFITEGLLDPPQCENASERSSSVPSLNETPVPGNSDYESLPEDPPIETKKRERSDEDNSTAHRRIKKKSETALPKNLFSSLRERLQKIEEKDKQRTDEIIQTVERVTKHLFNHLQRKDGERTVSYLNAAETASAAFDAEIDDLSLRAKRIQRAILYFKAGCSMSDYCDTLSNQFSKVREALKDFKEKKDTSQTIDGISIRLTHLIKSEIERSIMDEWETKRNRLMRCATILRDDFREFV